ncbi:protein phosphatase 2C, putative [Eimeria necatrix]|uniref:Protein phosphatase 2C, putative n=1 Tax=Eimeria necatrix TaxID=51315 RepID=U6MYW0_9EIME|nr:protein phosphatase 2C, putative [Eimeria necatrix]CDJ67674.1 protein phosphatase 2C, putative [Eimeria necatrix]
MNNPGGAFEADQRPFGGAPGGPEASLNALIQQTKRLTLAPNVQKDEPVTRDEGIRTSAFSGGPPAGESALGRRGAPARGPPSRGPPGAPGVRRKRLFASHASLSRAGSCGPGTRKTNQDACRVVEGWGPQEDALWVSVLDGHGPSGHLVSGFVNRRLPRLVGESWGPQGGLQKALFAGYLAANEELKKGNIDIFCSGTTCVACVLQERTLYVANVGDSRAILGRGPSPEGPWTAVPLTTDHKPELETERKRILAAGGRIAPLQEEDGSPCGPLRVWLPTDDVPGLAMSRSLGDSLAANVGVVAQPEVGTFSLREGDRCLLLASDGVWEFLSNEEALKTVKPFVLKGDPAGGCTALVNKARKKWEEEDGAIDDITALLVVF